MISGVFNVLAMNHDCKVCCCSDGPQGHHFATVRRLVFYFTSWFEHFIYHPGVCRNCLYVTLLIHRKVLWAILALVDHVLLRVVGESLDASLTADEQCTEDEGVAMTCVKSFVKTQDWMKEKLRDIHCGEASL